MHGPIILEGQDARDFIHYLIYGDDSDAKRYAFLKRCKELNIKAKEDGSMIVQFPDENIKQIMRIIEGLERKEE